MSSDTATKSTFTVDEAAHVLGVHRQTLYGAIRRGQVPAMRIGRRILISRQALADLLLGGSAAEPTPSGQPGIRR